MISQSGSGFCESTSSCGGFSVAGYCPGASNIQCCVSKTCSTPVRSSTFRYYISSNVFSQSGSGTCKSTSSCSGTSVAGYCPGSSSVQCCVPKAASTSCSTPVCNAEDSKRLILLMLTHFSSALEHASPHPAVEESQCQVIVQVLVITSVVFPSPVPPLLAREPAKILAKVALVAVSLLALALATALLRYVIDILGILRLVYTCLTTVQCCVAGASGGGGNLPGLDATQSTRARAIIAEAKKEGLGHQGCLAGIATGLTEVGLYCFWLLDNIGKPTNDALVEHAYPGK